MFIKVGEVDYELSTKLGVSLKMETKTKKNIMELLAGIGEASIDELIGLLTFGTNLDANSSEAKDFKVALLDNWDYIDLQTKTQEFLARLMFSGTVEQNEEKLEKFPAPEETKNAIRGLLGMPIPKAPEVDLTGNE